MAILLSQKGSESRLSSDMAFGKITKDQFLAGYAALTKATRGNSATGISLADLGYGTPAVPKVIPPKSIAPTPSGNAMTLSLKLRRQAPRAQMDKNQGKLTALQQA